MKVSDSCTAGYVLAGGRSSRMGVSKAGLPWQGTTLLEYVACEVRAAAGSVAIVGGEPLDRYRWIADAVGAAGPLGGIAAALADSRAEWNLIVACDMPGVTRSWLNLLLKQAQHDLTIPVTADERVHPLCAAWNASAGAAVRAALDRGVRRVTDVVKDLRLHKVVVHDETVVANVNTPEEWARFAHGRG